MTFRSSQWIIPALAATAAGFLAFAIARHMADRAAGPGLDRLRDISFLSRELQLTDPQVAQIKILHADLATRLDDCCARHCGARVRLGRTLADGTNGVARAEAVLSEMCQAYEESERAVFAHIRQVRARLDAEQRERFDRMLAESLCRECSSCAARLAHERTERHEH